MNLIHSLIMLQELRIFNVVEDGMKKMRLCERDTRILLYELITYRLRTMANFNDILNSGNLMSSSCCKKIEKFGQR